MGSESKRVEGGFKSGLLCPPQKVSTQVQTSAVHMQTDQVSDRSRPSSSKSRPRTPRNRFPVDDMIRERVGITSARDKH